MSLRRYGWFCEIPKTLLRFPFCCCKSADKRYYSERFISVVSSIMIEESGSFDKPFDSLLTLSMRSLNNE